MQESSVVKPPFFRTRCASVTSTAARWPTEGHWYEQVELERDEMMPLARKRRKMSKADAQAWVYAELDRLHPPQKADSVRFGSRGSQVRILSSRLEFKSSSSR